MENIFDRDFCNNLENEISKYFEENYTQNTKGFWCDGILFDYKLTNEIICFKAFVGKDGNTEYKLSLKIKKDKNYENKININNLCIDVERKIINIELE